MSRLLSYLLSSLWSAPCVLKIKNEARILHQQDFVAFHKSASVTHLVTYVPRHAPEVVAEPCRGKVRLPGFFASACVKMTAHFFFYRRNEEMSP